MLPLLVFGGVVAVVAAFVVGRRAGRRSVGTEAAQTPPPAHDSATDAMDIVDDLPTGVIVAEDQGRIVYRNAAALSMVGTHKGVLVDEVIERHLAAALRGDAGDEVVELYGPPRTVVSVLAHPRRSGGAVVFVDDISESRRVDQMRTDFVANISHELKTPIGALSVLAETMLGEQDPATLERLSTRMASEAERAARTVDDLMDLSIIELGGGRDREPIALTEVIRAAVDHIGELAAQREIGVSMVSPVDGAEGHGVVDGDRRQLLSAVRNLVENAVKYSDPGGTVQLRERIEGDWVEIIVSDRGPGIPQRDLDRIFERFYRVDRARSRQTGGTGLGLSIVRHVANNHGGTVAVSSIEGEGSHFTLRLPRRVEHGEQPADSDRGVA